MSINLHLPTKSETLRPTITVVGVGGAGGNAVNNMIASKLEGVSFVVANTDAQALENALTDRTIQLGANITRGLGAGASPDVGRAAAEEALEEIANYIQGSNMVFIAAGMGGGTGTGAAPVVARLAREQGILTVGVVTKPFQFEGTHRMRLAESGLAELQNYVDTLIVIPNQNLFRIANERTTFADAFKMADEVLHTGVRGVTDLIVKPGLVNLDFADIRTVMREMGKAMMGTGEASGDNRAVAAAEAAISNPLLDDVSLKGAKAVLINITGGPDLTLWEADEAAGRIREEVDPDANIIFGSTFHEAMEGKIRVSVVATGIDAASSAQPIIANRPVVAAAGEQKRPFSFGTAHTRPVEPIKAPAAVVTSPLKQEPVRDAVVAVAVAAKPAVSEAAREQKGFDFAPAAGNSFAVEETTFSFSQPRSTMVGSVAELNEQVNAKLNLISEENARFAAEQETAAQQQAAADEVVASISPRREQHNVVREEHAGMSFFQKVAGVGRALSRGDVNERKPERPQQERTVVSEKPRPEIVETTARPAAQQDEEYLDIPAFLRRQAN